MNRAHTKERCIQFEGDKRKPYWDCCSRGLREPCTKGSSHPGKLTLGVGRNIEDRSISQGTVDLWLDEDADSVEEDLRNHLPWVFGISENRQQVFFDLMFNMGWPKLSGFPNFLKHAENGEWDIAATHLLLSKYASQVGKRAKINAQMLREG